MVIKNPRNRRVFSLSLVVLGALFLFFAAQGSWVGWALLGLGVLLEVVGLTVGHRE